MAEQIDVASNSHTVRSLRLNPGCSISQSLKLLLSESHFNEKNPASTGKQIRQAQGIFACFSVPINAFRTGRNKNLTHYVSFPSHNEDHGWLVDSAKRVAETEEK